jgi:hypothetical protein
MALPVLPRVELACLCDNAFFDRHNRLCLIGVTATIGLPRLPMTIREMVLVARLQAGEGTQIRAEIRITQPGGTPGVPVDDAFLTLDLINDHLVATMRGIPLPREGTYLFEILLNGVPATEVPLEVKLATALSQSVH